MSIIIGFAKLKIREIEAEGWEVLFLTLEECAPALRQHPADLDAFLGSLLQL